MTRTASVFAALVLPAALGFAFPAAGAEDPVAARQRIMSAVGAAAGLAGGMLKGEIPYAPAAGLSALATFAAAGATYGDYFPEGSGGGESAAAPAIWEDRPGFDAALAEFADRTVAAASAAGEDGPADLEAFKAAAGPVLGTCRDCHETYRLRR